MPAPMFKVEVAFGQGPNTAAPSYTDISAYVRREPPLTYSRGNNDETQQLQSGSMSFVVDNRDGRFTAGSSAAASAWGSTLTIRHPVRLSIHNGTSYVVEWTGTVDDWGTGWANGKQGLTQVSCSDRVAQAGRIDMAPTLFAEILADGPLYFLPCSEDAGAQALADASVNNLGSVPLTVWAPDYVQTGYGSFGPEAQTGLRLTAPGTPYQVFDGLGLSTSSLSNFSIEAIVEFGTPAGTLNPFLYWGAVFDLEYSDGNLLINGPSATNVNPGSALVAGRTVHLVATAGLSGGTWTLRLYLNGVEVANNTNAGAAVSATDRLYLGNAGSSLSFSNIALYTSTLSASRVAEHYNALTGWNAELTGARWNRLCRLAGFDTSWYTADTGTVQMGPLRLSGKTLASALQDVVSTEQGAAYAAADGKLTLKQASARYNPASSLTLAPQTLERDLDFSVNDAYLVNDAIVTNDVTGVTKRDTDSASITAYGLYRTSDSVSALVDAQAYNLASWLTYKYATPQTRASQVSINQTQRASTVTAAQALALDVNSSITLSPLPSNAPASSVQLLIDGLAGSVGDTWQITYRTSPTTNSACWVLDTSTLGTSTITLY